MKKQWVARFAFAIMIALLVLSVLPVAPARAASRTASVSGNWNSTITWGGFAVPGSGDDVTINSGVTVTVPAGYSARSNSINFTTGTSGLASVTLADSTSSLTVTNAVTIQQQASGGYINQISVGAGTFTASSVTLSAMTDASRFSQILISSGTVTVSGNITSSGPASRIIFSGAGRINAGGTFMSGTAGTFTPYLGTVNFNATGAQTVGAYIYNNLMLSGSGVKTLPAGLSVTGNLSISGTATASVAAGQNLSVGTLNLSGQGTINGTWGSTSSPATFQTNTYFASTTGYLTVTTDTRSTQTPLTVTGPASIIYGSTGTITKTGGSGTGGLTYGYGSSTGCTVDSSSGVITVTSVPGSCTVTVTKSADKNYLADTSDGFDVDLEARAVTLSGSRAYDTTTLAAAGILSITNKVGADVVSIASGSATLANANVGTQPIVSMNTLTLGGAASANYTLIGGTGSVIISKADQTITFPAPASPVKYQGTFPVNPTSDSLLPVTVTPSGVCSIVGSTVTMTSGTGTCTLTASQAGNGNYNPAEDVERTVTAQKVDQVTLTVTGPLSVTYGTTEMITTSGGSGTGTLSYSQGASTGCTVNSSTGEITVTNVLLTCSVTATKAADDNYLVTSSAGFVVTLVKAAGSVSINNIPADAGYGSSFTPTFTRLGDGTTFVASLTPGTCSSGGTIVNFLSQGLCTLQALIAEGTNYLAATGPVQSFTIGKGTQTIIFTSAPPAPGTAMVGGTYVPTALGGASGNPVIFTVDPTAALVCSIDGNTVSFDANGVCVINANQAGNANYKDAIQTQQSFTIGTVIVIYLPFVFR